MGVFSHKRSCTTDHSTIKHVVLPLCSGKNDFGQLGIGDTSTRGDAGGEMGDNLLTVDLSVTPWALDSGYYHNCVESL